MNKDTTLEERFKQEFPELFSGPVRCERKEEHPCTGTHSGVYLTEEERKRLPGNKVLAFIKSEVKAGKLIVLKDIEKGIDKAERLLFSEVPNHEFVDTCVLYKLIQLLRKDLTQKIEGEEK